MGHQGLAYHAVHLVVLAVAVLIAARIVPGIRARSFGGALLFALVFAVLDKLLFWVLAILAFPAIILTFGLFIFVINGFLFWLADKLVEGVEVDGLFSATLGALVTSVVNMLVLWALGVG
jgi:putative membrane protein